ncbi:hypothetical protein PUN28_017165 [Cardiocondyla obscurior]|uniref:Uncharacterized protein n=1 Tax=Cardiocondyla obscurior TaxID=286306 RepID=A0AAW2EPU3_9HYME
MSRRAQTKHSIVQNMYFAMKLRQTIYFINSIGSKDVKYVKEWFNIVIATKLKDIKIKKFK